MTNKKLPTKLDATTLEMYFREIHTGQDMIDAKIIPKDFPTHNALVTRKRIQALKHKYDTELEVESLGSWVPLYEINYKEPGSIEENTAIKKKNLRVGSTVIGHDDVQGKIVSKISKSKVGIQWNEKVVDSSSDYALPEGVKDGFFTEESPAKISLVVDESMKIPSSYTLRNGVVANEKELAHVIKFTKDYGNDPLDNILNEDGEDANIQIKKGTIGRLTKVRDDSVWVQFDEDTFDDYYGSSFQFNVKEVADVLEVSSLGTIIPKDRIEEIKKNVLLDYFPTTVLDPDTARQVIVGNLMGKDMLLYGPPGTGKTNTSKDLVNIAKDSIKIMFKEADCQANCNPYSIFDPEFAKIVPPCPACKLKYDKKQFMQEWDGKELTFDKKDIRKILSSAASKARDAYLDATGSVPKMDFKYSTDTPLTESQVMNLSRKKNIDEQYLEEAIADYREEKLDKEYEKQSFKKTGHFKHPQAKDVDVLVLYVDYGSGFMLNDGTINLRRSAVAGIKMMSFDSDVKTDSTDVENFHPGALILSNNGLYRIEEMDKVRKETMDNLLSASNDNMVSPENLRWSFPSHQFIIGTANDNEVFDGPINDRFLFIEIPSTEDIEVKNKIMRVAYHKEQLEGRGNVEIGNTHIEQADILNQIPVPVSLEKAISAFYIKFVDAYQGEGKNDISASTRCEMDAQDAMRAEWLLDHNLDETTPLFPNELYAMKGIQFALETRIQGTGKSFLQETKEQLSKFVSDEFPAIYSSEKNKFWCDMYQEISILDRYAKNDDVTAFFEEEMDVYKNNPVEAINIFEEVKRANVSDATESEKAASLRFPFMGVLFNEQPNFAKTKPELIPGLMRSFSESRVYCSEHVKEEY